MWKQLIALSLLLLFSPQTSHADVEGWWIVDSRLPVYRRSEKAHRLSLRMQIDFRVAQRSAGLHQALMRLGFTWEPRPWLLLGSQTNANFQTNDGKQYIREWRQEFEGTVSMPLLSLLSFAHRQRFEFRSIDGQFSPRHRLLLRLNLMLPGPVHPYVWNELMVVSPPHWLNQNRLSVGIAWRPRRNLQVELGYLWRLRNTGGAGFVHDHAPRLALSFVPSYEASLPDTGGSE
jgi:hypothetical protein